MTEQTQTKPKYIERAKAKLSFGRKETYMANDYVFYLDEMCLELDDGQSLLIGEPRLKQFIDEQNSDTIHFGDYTTPSEKRKTLQNKVLDRKIIAQAKGEWSEATSYLATIAYYEIIRRLKKHNISKDAIILRDTYVSGDDINAKSLEKVMLSPATLEVLLPFRRFSIKGDQLIFYHKHNPQQDIEQEVIKTILTKKTPTLNPKTIELIKQNTSPKLMEKIKNGLMGVFGNQVLAQLYGQGLIDLNPKEMSKLGFYFDEFSQMAKQGMDITPILLNLFKGKRLGFLEDYYVERGLNELKEQGVPVNSIIQQYIQEKYPAGKRK
jgi:hypothetical protein